MGSLGTRYDELTNQLMDPTLMSQPSQLHKVNKERTDIEPVVKLLVRIATMPSSWAKPHKFSPIPR